MKRIAIVKSENERLFWNRCEKDYDEFADEWHIHPPQTSGHYAEDDERWLDECDASLITANGATYDPLDCPADVTALKLMQASVTRFDPPIPPFEELAYYRYGITACSGELLDSTANKYQGDMITKSFLLTNVERIGSENITKSTSAFLHGWKLGKNSIPPPLVWDIHPKSPCWLGNKPHPTIHIKEVELDKRTKFRRTFYHIEYKNDDLGWRLFVKDPVTALELYHSTTFINTSHAIAFLVLCGAAFHTLFLPSPREESQFMSQPSAKPCLSNVPMSIHGIRGLGPTNFNYYRATLKAFLESPRARCDHARWDRVADCNGSPRT
ncbi:hypothetical protein GSI_10369 [Ganoderma sinense ZZ0214-1]|uniref:Uncharacterized protein n=1 Tax=Ganoderma sinense ZZ0214-1 TaxID=1077348 RepID=A0A2G8S0F1_9APHY|nr:hypothetical protein GSI_10369 [Ganoderma sinense ZZ0214-1]